MTKCGDINVGSSRSFVLFPGGRISTRYGGSSYLSIKRDIVLQPSFLHSNHILLLYFQTSCLPPFSYCYLAFAMADEVQQRFETLQLHAGYTLHWILPESSIADRHWNIGKSQIQRRKPVLSPYMPLLYFTLPATHPAPATDLTCFPELHLQRLRPWRPPLRPQRIRQHLQPNHECNLRSFPPSQPTPHTKQL